MVFLRVIARSFATRQSNEEMRLPRFARNDNEGSHVSPTDSRSQNLTKLNTVVKIIIDVCP